MPLEGSGHSTFFPASAPVLSLLGNVHIPCNVQGFSFAISLCLPPLGLEPDTFCQFIFKVSFLNSHESNVLFLLWVPSFKFLCYIMDLLIVKTKITIQRNSLAVQTGPQCAFPTPLFALHSLCNLQVRMETWVEPTIKWVPCQKNSFSIL